MKLSNKSGKALLLTVCVILLVFCLLYHQDDINLIIVVDGHPHVYRVMPGDQLSIRYIHSVHLTPVTEVFRLQSDGTFSLLYTTFQDIGWGGITKGRLMFDGGRYFLTMGMEEKIVLPELSYRFVKVNQPRILLNNHPVQLFRLDQGKLIRIRLQPEK